MQYTISQEEFENLMDDLERIKTGTNVHTINKARSYLRSFFKGSWFLEDDEERAQLLERHVKRCREAVSTRNTDRLRLSMCRWV